MKCGYGIRDGMAASVSGGSTKNVHNGGGGRDNPCFNLFLFLFQFSFIPEIRRKLVLRILIINQVTTEKYAFGARYSIDHSATASRGVVVVVVVVINEYRQRLYSFFFFFLFCSFFFFFAFSPSPL